MATSRAVRISSSFACTDLRGINAPLQRTGAQDVAMRTSQAFVDRKTLNFHRCHAERYFAGVGHFL